MSNNEYSSVSPQGILKASLISKGINPESLCERELNYAEVTKMGSEEYDFHYLANRQNVENALLGDPKHKKQNRENYDSNQAQLLWSGKLAPEVADKYAKEQNVWLAEHPQLEKTPDNQLAIATWLAKKNLLPTVPNIELCYQDLCCLGLLTVSPENIGLEGSEITGYQLCHHPRLDLILQPWAQKTDEEIEDDRIKKMTGDEYKAEFLPNTEIPLRVLERIQRAVATFKETLQPGYLPTEDNRLALLAWLEQHNNMPVTAMSLNEAYLDLLTKGTLPDVGDTVVRSGVSTLINYSTPVPPVPVREVVIREVDAPKRLSLRDILAMSSSELSKAMSENSNIARELDNM